jgi:adenosylcobinamide kinase/adenosylcobinamide-phosphate guanylyltransferase
MVETIIGGSGSGKSQYAENHIIDLHKHNDNSPLIYIATMVPYGKEMEEKIKRHREMRRDKHFLTMECFTDLKAIEVEEGSTALLECMSNLVANEMFMNNRHGEHAVSEIISGIHRLKDQCEHVLIVTNDIFLEGCLFDETTIEYMKCLSQVNSEIAALSDRVVEVVCGIPLEIKS